MVCPANSLVPWVDEEAKEPNEEPKPEPKAELAKAPSDSAPHGAETPTP